jgi:hypothetical protein
MVVRILMLLLAFAIVVNLFITACCYMTGENLYKKYGKQMSIGVCLFAILVCAIYVAVSMIGFKV